MSPQTFSRAAAPNESLERPRVLTTPRRCSISDALPNALLSPKKNSGFFLICTARLLRRPRRCPTGQGQLGSPHIALRRRARSDRQMRQDLRESRDERRHAANAPRRFRSPSRTRMRAILTTQIAPNMQARSSKWRAIERGGRISASRQCRCDRAFGEFARGSGPPMRVRVAHADLSACVREQRAPLSRATRAATGR